MKELAPIIFFVYNRPKHTKISIEFLKKNELAKESEIIIFSDGPRDNDEDKRKVQEVRNILHEINGFKKKKIILRENNFGLYKNFVNGITEACNNYNKIIVLEDDNKTSKYFLNFINDGLNLYENDHSVCSINGWFYPKKNDFKDTFFLLGGNTWGWGTWKRAWDKFNPDTGYLINEIKKKNLVKKFNLNNSFNYFKMLEKRHQELNDSHTIIWKASTFLNQMYSLYPNTSLVENIGFDGLGTHNKIPDDTHKHKSLSESKIFVKKIKIEENIEVLKFIENFYRVKKIKNFFNRFIKRLINFFE
tara:strand:- start:1249 stop:2160 length:912 start_codon:yes stop_codon:yes gene_type:complete